MPHPALIALIALPALIHLLPLPGVLGAGQLERLYGVPVPDPNLLLAMRHRAVLFALLGVALIAGIVLPDLRVPALVACLVSDVAFAGLALATPQRNAKMKRVLAADWVSLACLIPALGWSLAG